MTNEQYHATLKECLSLVWDAQLQLERAIDALTDCHIAICAATSKDRLDRALNKHQSNITQEGAA